MGMNQPHAHLWQTKPEPITGVTRERDCDIVIIGAGISGCTAAEAATSAGADVLVCEKFGTFTAHGIDVGAVGTTLQKERGVEIDKLTAARLIYDWSQQQANYFLIRTHVERSGAIMDRYIKIAESYGLEVHLNDDSTARADWSGLEDRFRMFSSAHLFALTDRCAFKKRKWSVSYFVEAIYEQAKKQGAEFKFNTTADQLVKEDGRVTGVIVSDQDGYLKINARKGVILATGGITDNTEMIRCFWPAALRADTNQNFPVGGNMGDGLVMGAWAGAALSRCNPAPIIHPVDFSVLGPGINSSWLTVNRDGRRFSCEVGYEPIVTNARVNAPGNVAFAIFDSNYRENMLQQEPLKAQKILDGLDQAIEDEVKTGAYVKGETLEELGEKLGMPPGALQKTVARYNDWCDKGYDGDFGVPARFLCSCRRGPFYASTIKAWLLNIPYGLHVDHNSQVCTESDEPIPGLFAVGNVQGDFFANSYPVTLPGTSHGRSLTYGYLVGKALAEDTVLGGYGEL